MRRLLVVLLYQLWSFSAFAAGETGFRLISNTVTSGSYSIPYTVYLPSIDGPVAGLPITLFLHGSGQRGNDGQAQLTEGIGPAFTKHPERFNTIIVLPQCPSDMNWSDHMNPQDLSSPLVQDLALQALDETTATYLPSATQVYLTGLSLGGISTYAIAAEYPDRFAAIMPIAGTGDPAIAPALAQMPIWSYHGDLDSDVPIKGDRALIAAIRATGNPNVHFTQVLLAFHDVWDQAYRDKKALHWLFRQKLPH